MSIEDERERFWKALEANGKRIDELEQTMQEIITEAVRDAMPVAMPTAKQLLYIDMAIEQQAKSAKFRDAVIEKTLVALIWAGVIAIGLVFREYAITHGMWKS